ncbi:hypothetical protein [Rhizobium leguminosarum]|uniref:hypothetical protein n=1 Tax=Rhizobium leguminosarum TaxID=384 RepID=UPI001F2EF2E6|nr:hypothetical protein [Rhizobium leguminosarum]UIJ81750.1 hypothetical protein LZK78_10910 [Rhizobium leguminosarum]
MGYIDKHFDGEPLIGILMGGGRVASAPLEVSEWTIDQFDDAETLDVCELIEVAEAAVFGRRQDVALFDAAPSVDAMQEIFREAVLDCADAGVFRSVSASHRFFRRHWFEAARLEGLKIVCPSHRVFERAVELELQHRANSTGDVCPQASYRPHPIHPSFGH